jgi:hypothetical protein
MFGLGNYTVFMIAVFKHGTTGMQVFPNVREEISI